MWGKVSAMSRERRVEAIRKRLEAVVSSRHDLREQNASPLVLERNRRRIVKLQHDLAVALIALYARAPVEEAA